MSNRVEELESRVAELQAAVDGLTEELVETRERLRKLEDGGERGEAERVTPAGDDGRTTADEGGEPDTGAEPEADPDHDPDEADAEAESGDDESSSGTDEIIIA